MDFIMNSHDNRGYGTNTISKRKVNKLNELSSTLLENYFIFCVLNMYE